MGGIEKSIEIRAPPEKVWEMLALDRFPEWMDSMKSVAYTSEVRTSEDKYRVGASAHVIAREGEFDLEIMENIENEKISSRWRGTERVRNTIVTYTLKPTEAGTEMTYAVDYEMPWGVLGKFLDKLFAQRMAEKTIEKESKK
ncbi:MAG: SRPBCC family protein, partial [Nitrososphaeria archaeon]